MRTRLRLAAPLAVLLLSAAAVLTGCGSSTMAGEHDHDKRAGNTPVTPGAREIKVTGEANHFAPDVIEVTEGEDVAITLVSADTDHDLNIEGVDAHVVAVKNASATGGFTAPAAGEYKIFCSEPGHKEAGMTGMLKVKPKAGGGSGSTAPAGGAPTTMAGM